MIFSQQVKACDLAVVMSTESFYTTLSQVDLLIQNSQLHFFTIIEFDPEIYSARQRTLSVSNPPQTRSAIMNIFKNIFAALEDKASDHSSFILRLLIIFVLELRIFIPILARRTVQTTAVALSTLFVLQLLGFGDPITQPRTVASWFKKQRDGNCVVYHSLYNAAQSNIRNYMIVAAALASAIAVGELGGMHYRGA